MPIFRTVKTVLHQGNENTVSRWKYLYASWEFRTMVSFILMSCQVTGKVPNMMS